jgi:hypothetical protein
LIGADGRPAEATTIQSGFFAVFLFAGSLCGSAGATEGGNLRIKVQGGTLEGSIETSGMGGFKGVPFAAPPVGERPDASPHAVRPGIASNFILHPTRDRMTMGPWVFSTSYGPNSSTSLNG